MKPSEILELVRAGYTKAEIEAMNQTEPPKPTDPEPEPEPKPEPKPQPEPQPEPVKPIDPQPVQHIASESEKLLAALGLKLDTLTQAVQAGNVSRIEGKAPGMTTDDIIARIINPHLDDKEVTNNG